MAKKRALAGKVTPATIAEFEEENETETYLNYIIENITINQAPGSIVNIKQSGKPKDPPNPPN